MSLTGKVAIVTGSARGIGASVAVALAKEGANVVVNYVSPSSKVHAESVAKTIEGTGSKALVVQADLASVEALELLVQKTVEQFGKIDILVNNGGVVDFQPIGGITIDSYQKIFDINVRGIIFLSQAAAAHMGDGGRIINVSSTAARQGNPGSLVYAASKSAVEGITRVMAVELRDRGIRVMAVELRDRGIRVNSINPGPVTTDMFHSLSEDVQEYFRSSQPVAKPEDIADVVVFLASPKSRWVNGGTINTNNGVVLN